MAEIKHSFTKTSELDLIVTWAAVANADTFEAIDVGKYKDASYQIKGTFGGTTVAIQGSNDDTTFATLVKDGTGAATATAADLFDVTAKPKSIKPLMTGGAASSITVVALFRL